MLCFLRMRPIGMSALIDPLSYHFQVFLLQSMKLHILKALLFLLQQPYNLLCLLLQFSVIEPFQYQLQ